jgi:hypothetical protein
MKVVYWLLPFIKQIPMSQVIIHNIGKNITKKNFSMYNNFDILDPTVQRYLLQC